ncbi:hypothetical protein [Halanaerobacter jeridensis]|uniref:Asparagine N-glycosylation enzyme membrane subunit Stt3 n=1 Tax=Halanaerobacter jeridensis TaxID=706427 RepID=A0A938XUI1_9FIRM|nr:hypothetical protein [Halanaerobacter jeridensis]MBM7557793.1 asparagine N-glycosylation enzyme membrane subunit Stt3 [Halanaerobacter jeridensis]
MKEKINNKIKKILKFLKKYSLIFFKTIGRLLIILIGIGILLLILILLFFTLPILEEIISFWTSGLKWETYSLRYNIKYFFQYIPSIISNFLVFFLAFLLFTNNEEKTKNNKQLKQNSEKKGGQEKNI